MTIYEVVKRAKEMKASDVHFVFGQPIKVRIHGVLNNFDDTVLDDEMLENFVDELAGKITENEYDMAVTIGETRCRINIFKQQDHHSIALRMLNNTIPDLSVIGLPDVVKTFTEYNRGIVIITGETGSGKSTTLAALLDSINHKRKEHIITLEDPIEYIYKSDQCLVNQREIGKDTASYEDGLKAILREDPDIILIGEMRSQETIEIALTAAETGHLVFATLHTNSCADSIDRIVDVFPSEKQRQIRMQLSMTLKAVVSQQLLPNVTGDGRVLAYEIMIVNNAIKNLIREGKTPQINNSIATTANEGNVTMDNCLLKLVKDGKIDPRTAYDAASDKEYVGSFVKIASPTQKSEMKFF